MRNRRQTDEKLENIGSKLIAAGALSESEIDRIVAREDLFADVLARVNSVEKPQPAEPFNLARFVRRHELGISGAFAVVLCAGVFGLYLQQKPSGVVDKRISIPVGQPDKAPLVDTPQVDVTGITSGGAQDRTPDRVIPEPSAPAPIAAERAVLRQNRSESPRVRTQTAAAEVEPPVKEFYPVTYTGENGDGIRGGRVIRVDLSRATLFAMGINVPLENESPTIKADLLVGPDGVTRAIRLVD